MLKGAAPQATSTFFVTTKERWFNCLYLEFQLLNRLIALCTIHRIVHLDFEKLIQLIKRFIPAVDSVIDLLRNWGQLAKLESSTLMSWVAGCECIFYGIISVPHCRKKNMFKNTLKFGLTIGFLLKKKKKKKKKKKEVVKEEEEEEEEEEKRIPEGINWETRISRVCHLIK